jgi:hypothetical protein
VKKISLIVFIVGFVLLVTCTKEVAQPGICFEEDVYPVIVSNCTTVGCHNSADREADYDFTTYNGIVKAVKPGHPALSEIYNVIKGNFPSMPPAGALSKQDVETIRKWIVAGAPNNSGCYRAIQLILHTAVRYPYCLTHGVRVATMQQIPVGDMTLPPITVWWLLLRPIVFWAVSNTNQVTSQCLKMHPCFWIAMLK